MKIVKGHEVVGRFAALDGLRGIAALAVVVGHVTTRFYGQAILDGYVLAVPFFFMLSGFVLEYVYGRPLRSGASMIGFLVRGECDSTR